MKKTPPPLPPLSLQALHDVEIIDRAVQDSLEGCINAVRNLVNPEKASRILRTCLVESLNVQIDYYSSLPNYHPIWLLHIMKRTVDSMVDLFPVFTSGEQFRDELLLTAVDHLKERGVRSADATTKPSSPALKEADSVGAQISRLREECRLTVEALAEGIDVDVRSVRRHIGGQSVPYQRHIWAYEKLFSNILNRKVVINKMS
jgi:hypothetical protein